MTDFEPKTSQKGSGNTSSRSSKKDNEKGFKKVALKFELDIDENNRIIDTLLEEFKKTGLSEPHASIYAERQQKEVTVARYITNGLTNKQRVIFYLKTLKKILTYPSSVLKEADEITERIVVLTKLLNPTKDDIDPTLSSSYNDSEIGMNLLDLHIDCLLVVRVTGNIENNTFDGEEERIDIGGYLWSVQFETQEKKQAFSRKTVRDILNIELDYRNYQFQMLRSKEEMTFDQFLENKHGSSKKQVPKSEIEEETTEQLLARLQADVARESGENMHKKPSRAFCTYCQNESVDDANCALCNQNVEGEEDLDFTPTKPTIPSGTGKDSSSIGTQPSVDEGKSVITKKLSGVEKYVRYIRSSTPNDDPVALQLKNKLKSL